MKQPTDPTEGSKVAFLCIIVGVIALLGCLALLEAQENYYEYQLKALGCEEVE